jgi:hypothetical protein
MSTLVFRYDGDGHKPRGNSKGNLVAWGNTSLNVVHVPNPSAIWRIGEGRHLRFLDDRRVVWLRNLTDTTADLYHDDLRFFSGGIKELGLDPSLIAGNDFEAANGHWASVLINERRLTYDGQRRDVSARAVRMCGDYMLTVEQSSSLEYFSVYLNGQLSRRHPLPSIANEFKINEDGWISYGYYGPTRILTPDGESHQINVTADESVARIIRLSSGQVWAWTSTVINNQPFVLGRPLVYDDRARAWSSDDECVQLPFPAEGVDVQWWEEKQSFTVAGSANLGTTTPLEVHVVPLSHPRTALPPIEPPVEPPEDDMNKPGINVFDYAKTIHSGSNTQIVHCKDRNNPGVEFKVLILNGSLKVEMTYDGWQTKSDYTGSSRPVTIKG